MDTAGQKTGGTFRQMGEDAKAGAAEMVAAAEEEEQALKDLTEEVRKKSEEEYRVGAQGRRNTDGPTCSKDGGGCRSRPCCTGAPGR